MEHSDDALARLILVVVTWSQWEPKKDRTRYEELIRKFLWDSAVSSGGVSRAHMHQCYEEYYPRQVWKDDLESPIAVYGLFNG